MKRSAFVLSFVLGTLLCFLFSVSTGQLAGKKSLDAPAPTSVPSSPGAVQFPSVHGTSLESCVTGFVRHIARENGPVMQGPISRRGGNTIEEYGHFGGVNGILYLPGDTSSYVAMPDKGTFYNGNNVDGSIEMWINPTRPANYLPAELISKGATDAQEFLFGIVLNRLYFRINHTDVWASGDTIPVNTWTHVAVTWTGGGPYFVRFYMNGYQEGPVDTLTDTWVANTDTLVIGGASNRTWSGEAFAGYIDEVRFWNPQLPQSTIIQNRFVGLGDGDHANDLSAITAAQAYTGLLDSWTFNAPGPPVLDDIGGNDAITEGGSSTWPQKAGEPMPYNFALSLRGDDSAYVRIPSSTSFDRTVAGSLEMWIKPSRVNNSPVLISKGTTYNVSFVWGIESSDSMQFFRIGNTVYLDTMKVPINVWSHVGVTWRNGPDFVVSFYLDGRKGRVDSIVSSWNINTDPIIIGGDSVPGVTWEYYSGYLDEVRFWARELTQTEIANHMFTSGRALWTDPDLLGFWNFDGNLLNLGSVRGADGSFNNGRPNDARLSAYRVETLIGPPMGIYGSHSTVIGWYWGGGSGIWPNQFQVTAPFAPIHDNDTVDAAISQMVVTNLPGTVGNVTVFLAIDHTYINDVVARLTAPNGMSHYLLNNSGHGNENALTFFDDTFSDDPTSTTYMAPWGWLKAIEPMGNFGGSPLQGTWTLKVFDNAFLDSGVVKGWGLRFYNTVGVREEQSPLPAKFELAQNYPNPFNPTTTINFSIPRETEVALTVYNILGQQVATLVHEMMKPGNHAIVFNAEKLASGTYFYRLTAGSYTATRKMILLK